MKILDVGCGVNKVEGAVGLDISPRSHADVIHDLNVVPYPFDDNEFDLVVANHVVEHVPDVWRSLPNCIASPVPAGG